jgi:hypothetical protein
LFYPTLTRHCQNGLNMNHNENCMTCDRGFGSRRAAVQHMDALQHWGPLVKCETCDREFSTQRSADQHMKDTGHQEPPIKREVYNKKPDPKSSMNQQTDASNRLKRHDSHDSSRPQEKADTSKAVCPSSSV